MDLLLILTYAAVCIAIFKVFKIPLNKWSVPTAVLGGIFLIGALIFVMNYNHPYSEISRQYFVTTPIVPTVSGRVVEVPVKGNAKLKKGDVLFRIVVWSRSYLACANWARRSLYFEVAKSRSRFLPAFLLNNSPARLKSAFAPNKRDLMDLTLFS